MFLVCHVIWYDNMIKGPSDIMSRSRLKQVATLPSLVAVGYVVVRM